MIANTQLPNLHIDTTQAAPTEDPAQATIGLIDDLRELFRPLSPRASETHPLTYSSQTCRIRAITQRIIDRLDDPSFELSIPENREIRLVRELDTEETRKRLEGLDTTELEIENFENELPSIYRSLNAWIGCKRIAPSVDLSRNIEKIRDLLYELSTKVFCFEFQEKYRGYLNTDLGDRINFENEYDLEDGLPLDSITPEQDLGIRYCRVKYQVSECIKLLDETFSPRTPNTDSSSLSETVTDSSPLSETVTDSSSDLSTTG